LPQRSATGDAFLLGLGPAVGLGLGRFAYSLIAPAMQADLGWSFSLIGWLNAANALGYLSGAILAPLLLRKVGAARTFRAGLCLVPVALALTAMTESAALLAVLRFLVGIAAGAIFVSGGTLAVNLSARAPKAGGLALSIFYAGAGLGMTVSALTLPALFHLRGAAVWPWAWALLAAMAAAGAAIAARIGGDSVGAGPTTPAGSAPLLRLWRILFGYTLFGLGSIGYLTFIFGWLADQNAGPLLPAVFWGTLGLAALAAPLLWRRPLDRLRHGLCFGLLVGLNALGAALPFALHGLPGIMSSALLFGATFFTTVAATSAFVSRLPLTMERAAVIRAFTVAFGVGQLAGPVAVGWATDVAGTLTAPLIFAVAFIFAGAVIGAAQKDVVFHSG